MNIITEEFSNISNLIDALEQRQVNKVFSHDSLDSQKIENGKDPWSGTKTYSDAVHLLAYGYDDILEQIKTSLNVPVRNIENARIPRNDVVGYLPNVPNALQGLPNSMINIKTVKKSAKVINLIYAPVANASFDPDTFITNGVKILNAINTLELNGIRVNLKIAFKFSRCGSEHVLATVSVKHESEQLNIKKICFPIAHPAMLRRIGFKWLETTKKISSSSWTISYGQSANDSDFKMLFENKIGKNTRLITLQDIVYMDEMEILEEITS